jgi:hypothetical protein
MALVQPKYKVGRIKICEVHATTTCSTGDLDDDSTARVNEVNNSRPPSSQVLPRAVSVRLSPLPNATSMTTFAA